MHRLIHRPLGMGPNPLEVSRVYMTAVVTGWAEGVQRREPLTAQEMAHVLEYSGGVARRAFPALYDNEDLPYLPELPGW
ncbi:hypothetical protein ACFY3M_51650 [Streptomyces mirabilis]|uniref:hypothetical protein n=1 Tax=Streptomyces mirabilis TaxID=68239 RepID=UPI00368F3C70